MDIRNTIAVHVLMLLAREVDLQFEDNSTTTNC